MRALATGDVDQGALTALRDDLGPDLELIVDARRIMLKSAEPPSWIQLFADAPWWTKALAGYAALYVAELVKEAAKETWRGRAKIAAAAVSGTGQLTRLAKSLARLRARLPDRTRLLLGLPVPDDYFGVRFELLGREEELLAAEIALFVHHLPELEALIAREGLRDGRVTGAVTLLLNDSGAMNVAWMDRTTLRIEERVLVRQ